MPCTDYAGTASLPTFGVDRPSRCPFTARTNTQTDRHTHRHTDTLTDATGCPTHVTATAAGMTNQPPAKGESGLYVFAQYFIYLFIFSGLGPQGGGYGGPPWQLGVRA